MAAEDYRGVYKNKEDAFYRDGDYTLTAAQAELTASELKIGTHTYAARIAGGASQKNLTVRGKTEDVHWVYLVVEKKKAGALIFFSNSQKVSLYLGKDNIRMAALVLTISGFTARLPDDTEIVWNDWQGSGEKYK
ncbi:hypothetical protein AGMMS50268_35100 [Spirochaetia bacterium]|nr:hypothetical protein AGMMS50268_35100 [Spirochaetia bacterium]